MLNLIAILSVVTPNALDRIVTSAAGPNQFLRYLKLNFFQAELQFLEGESFLRFEVPAGQHQLRVDERRTLFRKRKSSSFLQLPDPRLYVFAEFLVAGTHLGPMS